MRFGLTERFDGTRDQGVDYIQAYARTAEQLGFSSFWAPEHMVFFERYRSTYLYSDSGRNEIGPDQGSCYCFLVLAAVALATADLRIGQR